MHGGLHSVMGARTCFNEHQKGLIRKDHWDDRWEEYMCRLYCFPGKYEDHKDDVFLLGHEDNLSYQKVTPFYEFYRSVRRKFVESFAARDSNGNLLPDEVWPATPPEPYKSQTEYKRALKEWIMARLPKSYSDKKKTSMQVLKFATRKAPINTLIWNLLIGNYAAKKMKKKKEIDGVSTFCHLEGLDDQSTLDLLTNVFYGNITIDAMRQKAGDMKKKKRCFDQALEHAKELLAIKDV